MLHLTDELSEFVSELEDARAAKKIASDRESAARAALIAALEDAGAEEALVAGGHAGVRLETQHRTSVDSKKLEALFPEVFENCRKESTIRVLRLT